MVLAYYAISISRLVYFVSLEHGLFSSYLFTACVDPFYRISVNGLFIHLLTAVDDQKVNYKPLQLVSRQV
jgi:hypothetical protein